MTKSQARATYGPPMIRAVVDLQGMEALRPAWDALVKASPHAGVAQTYLYAHAGWETRRPDAQHLLVLVAEQAGRMVAVWPLFVAKPKTLKIVRLLGCGGREEYCEPLIAADCPDQAFITAELYRLATDAGDLLEAYNIAVTSPMITALRAEKRTKHKGRMGSPVIDLSKWESWDAWFASRSKNFRYGLRSARRRLALDGELVFREISAENAPSFIDWLFTTKRAWLERRKLVGPWILDPNVYAFYNVLVGHPESGVFGFSLDLDDKPIAGCISLVSASRMEFFVVTYDTAYALASPGNLLIEDLVRWCMPPRLDFDFRLTGAPYKDRWVDRVEPYIYYDVACTWRGIGTVRARQAVQAWRAFKGGAKQRLKRLTRGQIPALG